MNFYHLPDLHSVKNSDEDSGEMLFKYSKKNNYWSEEEFKRRKASFEVRKFSFLFPAITRIASGNRSIVNSKMLKLNVHSVSESSDIWHTYFSFFASNSIYISFETCG